jgi:hypothetical protein
MALLEGEGSAVDVPVEADGGPECGGGSCFVFGVAGTDMRGEAVGRAGVADGSRGGSRCVSC